MPVKNQTKTFTAALERMPGNLGWTVVRLPFDVRKVWGQRRYVRVKGEINGFAFATSSLFPARSGRHFMLVNKKVLKGARVQAGVTARFTLQPDTTKRVATPSAELEKILKQSRLLRKFYESFSESYRKYIADWVREPKSAESRKRRAEQMAERMMSTMEAERELPPVIELALRENPRAREGWARMTPKQRRGELMGIFGYQSVESRAKRIAKAIELMLQHAGEKRSRKDFERSDDTGRKEGITLRELQQHLSSLDHPD